MNRGRELRQVATVWPNCWNSQDCDPPKVWFDPAMFNDGYGAAVSLDVLLGEADSNVTRSLAPFNSFDAAHTAAAAAASITLCTNGTWVVGSARGTGIGLRVSEPALGFESAVPTAESAHQSGGRLLANETIGPAAAWQHG